MLDLHVFLFRPFGFAISVHSDLQSPSIRICNPNSLNIWIYNPYIALKMLILGTCIIANYAIRKVSLCNTNGVFQITSKKCVSQNVKELSSTKLITIRRIALRLLLTPCDGRMPLLLIPFLLPPLGSRRLFCILANPRKGRSLLP